MLSRKVRLVVGRLASLCLPLGLRRLVMAVGGLELAVCRWRRWRLWLAARVARGRILWLCSARRMLCLL